VSYKLYVYQTSPDDEDGDYGNLLHEEVGQWMYNSFPASGKGEVQDWSVARMSVVPHGVTFVATGNNSYYEGPQDSDEEVSKNSAKEALLKEQNDFDLSVRVAPQDCVPADTYDTNGAPWGKKEGDFGWGEEFKGREGQYLDMNPLLTTLTEKVRVKSFATLSVKADGDLSMTPFIKTQSKNSDFTGKFWLQSVVGEDGVEYARLQYAQRVTWSFMQQFRCLDCQGGVPAAPTMGPNNTPFNTKNKCWTSCNNMDQVWGTADKFVPLAAGAERFVNKDGGESYHPTKPQDVPTWTLNQLPASNQRRCYSCTANMDDSQPAQAFNSDSDYSTGNYTQIPIDYERQTLQAASLGKTCKEDHLAHWPHMQVNTLRKVSDDYADTGPLLEFTEKLGDLNFKQSQGRVLHGSV
jgi:hypothetical protein